jgi:3-oxoacyl-[acyl-carrier protein] reductase
MEFEQKRVLITGGTKGLGKAMAIAFAREGAWVAVNYTSDEESAAETREALGQITSRTLTLRADVSSRPQVDAMVRGIREAWDRLDILINNAGIIRDKLLMFLNEEDWDRVLEVNLKGTYLCARAVLRSMVGQRWGRIINLTSPSAITGRAGQTSYAASKGGIISFTKSLARETAKLGITVNALCPGVISTPMVDALDEEIKQDLLKMIPMGTFGDAEDVAAAALFLASGRAKYITGQIMAVDGGLT